MTGPAPMGPLDLVSIALAFFIVTVSPGPANIALATVSMRFGRKRGLLFGAGLGAGLAFWGLVAATGLGAVLQGSAAILSSLNILAGLYLLWLAFLSGRSAMQPTGDTAQETPDGKWFARGLVLNLCNPKAVVAWIAALSMGLGHGDGGGQLVIATVICVGLGFLNYSGYALAFSLSGFMAGYRRLSRWIDGAVAALFAAAGVGLIRSVFIR